jgi:hypothetical protein
MICSASQIDSFWKTLVLSNDCESSMRAMVSEPPRLGVPADAPVVPEDAPPLDPPPPVVLLLPELPQAANATAVAAVAKRATPL